MKKLINLIGQKFGRLTIINRVYPNVKKWRSMWLCKCECGKKIIVDGGNLRNGHTKSCGCLKKEYGKIIGELNKLSFRLARDNVVPCCRTCNRAKDISNLQEYKDWIRRSYNYMFNNKRGGGK